LTRIREGLEVQEEAEDFMRTVGVSEEIPEAVSIEAEGAVEEGGTPTILIMKIDRSLMIEETLKDLMNMKERMNIKILKEKMIIKDSIIERMIMNLDKEVITEADTEDILIEAEAEADTERILIEAEAVSEVDLIEAIEEEEDSIGVAEVAQFKDPMKEIISRTLMETISNIKRKY
jgi:hypothetical protein